MANLNEFIKDELAVLIAPAGHGKTTTIADYLLLCNDGECQLVLTHTHAGIASLRKKFTREHVPSNRYQLETITGFAQRYVLNFLGETVLPNVDDENYFDEAVNICTHLLNSPLLQKVITCSYQGIIIDEYQDCTYAQHLLIMAIGKQLPIHILGDDLQGIFSFEKKPMVNFSTDLAFFNKYKFLTTPWRWQESNPKLGDAIYSMRCALEANEKVLLQDNPIAELRVFSYTGDPNEFDAEYLRWLRYIIHNYESSSTLIITPSYHEIDKYGKERLRGDIQDRINLKNKFDFSNSYTILDAIDSKSYYSIAKKIDAFLYNCLKGKRIKRIQHFYDIAEKIHFSKECLNKWIKRKENRFIPRTKYKEESQQLQTLWNIYDSQPSTENLYNLFYTFSKLPDLKCQYCGIRDAVIKCFKYAEQHCCSLYEAMKHLKSIIRHQGRIIEGKCIGTTLLTKGLEFDTVIILYPERFEDKKNFYVAISRACKTLVFITSTNEILFDK